MGSDFLREYLNGFIKSPLIIGSASLQIRRLFYGCLRGYKLRVTDLKGFLGIKTGVKTNRVFGFREVDTDEGSYERSQNQETKNQVNLRLIVHSALSSRGSIDPKFILYCHL